MGPRVSRLAITLSVLLGLSSTGGLCGPGGDPPEPTTTCADGDPPPDGQDTVQLGRIQGGFQALQDNDVLYLESGAQGGQHVFVVVRQYATVPVPWHYDLRFQAEDGTDVADNDITVKVCAPGWTETQAPVFWYGGSGRTFVLRLVATNPDADATLTAEVPVRVLE